MPTLKNTVILYHADCEDGFGGAWAARKKLGDKASYIAVKHGFPPPQGLKNKTVYMIDFAYPGPMTRTIARHTAKLVVIDHHLSHQKIVEKLPNHLFSLKHSGAVLSWDYFHPGKTIPLLLRYVEDIDLWKFSLPHAREFSGFIESIPHNFEYWDKLIRDFENSKRRSERFREGALILRYNENIVNDLIRGGREVVFEGYPAFAVNSPVLNSKIGATLIKQGYPVAVMWATKSGRIEVSLRSSKRVDVSRLAVRHGGGGHPRAAGFQIALNKNLPCKTKN